MKRGTWVLLVIVAALAAFIFLWERGRPTTQDRESGRLLSLKAEKVVRLSRTGDSPVVLVKRGETWDLEKPVADKADRYGVEGFLDQVSAMTGLRAVGAGTSEADLGLKPPRAVWSLETGGDAEKVEVGAQAPLKEGLYVRADGKVWVVPSDMEGLLMRPVDEFRLKDLTAVPTADVEAFSWSAKAPVLAAEKSPAGWNVTIPFRDWGAESAIQTFLDDLCLCPVFGFSKPEVTEGSAGLEDPVASFELTLKGGRKVRVALGGPVPGADPGKDLVYASSSDRPGIMEVSRNSLRFLKSSPENYRSDALFRHSLYEADSVAVEGAYTVKLVRDEKTGWRFDTPKKAPAGADASVLAAGLTALRAGGLTPGAGAGPDYLKIVLKGAGFSETLVIGPEGKGGRVAKPQGREGWLVLDADPWHRAEAALRLAAGPPKGEKP